MKSILQALAVFFVLFSAVTLADDCQQGKCDTNTELSLVQENTCSKDGSVCQTSNVGEPFTLHLSLASGTAQVGDVTNAKLTAIDASTHNYCTAARNRCDLDHLNNVLNPVSYFQERKEKSESIYNASTTNSSKTILVVITGFRGSGKTELAIKYAHDHEKEYHHTRFFDASDEKKLLDGFKSFATNLCLEDRIMCSRLQDAESETCVIDIVKRCLKETNGKFLWIFDDVKTFTEIEKYIPNEKDINGVILITTKNKGEFLNEDRYLIDLSGAMTKEQSRALLTRIIQEKIRMADISSMCNTDEIEEIATNIWKNLPLAVSHVGMIIGRIKNCSKYIILHNNNPESEADFKKSLAIHSQYDLLQEEAIREELLFLNNLNLDIVGFLSFIDTPFPKNLLVIYIGTNNECRKFLGLNPLPIDTTGAVPYMENFDLFTEERIKEEIDGFSLVIDSNNLLSFPHDLFKKQVQLYILRKDSSESYKKLFDQTTDFLCRNFSGAFWDRIIWKNEKDNLLRSVEKIVNTFLTTTSKSSDNKNTTKDYVMQGREKIQPLGDSQLTLWCRLAKYYIQENPARAVELFDELHQKITDGDTVKSGSLEYLENSINHANVMHNLAIAICQAHYLGSIDISVLDKAEELVESAYKIFENKFGKDNPRTFNAYLVLMHIRINLKNYTATEKPKSYIVKFSGSEPTINAAIALTDLKPETETFENLKNELSWPEKYPQSRSYLSSYANLEKKY